MAQSPSHKPNRQLCQLTNISKTYPLGDLQVTALSAINLDIYAGEFTVFAGPSGSGKSTLLNLIGLLDTPTQGCIYLHGKDTAALPEKQLELLRAQEIGFIFQSFHLIPVLTARENVELSIRLSKRYPKAQRTTRTEHILTQVGLADYMDRYPRQLSGGQQQRVAIARALVKEPSLIIADEPTANLDTDNGNQILQLMENLNTKQNTTFLFSTHDPMVVKRAKRIIRLQDGHIQSDETSSTAAQNS